MSAASVGSVVVFADERDTRGRPIRGHLLRIPVTEHGTFDRWRLHVAVGEQPCASCAGAAAQYWTDRRQP